MHNTTQHLTEDEFNNLVACAHSWQSVASGGFEVVVPGDANTHTDKVTHVLSETALNAYHPMLFQALLRLVNLNKKMRLVERVEGKAVVATLKEWSHPLHIRTVDGEQLSVLGIEQVKCSPQHKQVLLTVQRYDVHHTDENGISIAIAGNPYRDFPIITAQDMDSIFPGWFLRFKVASELGYTGRELANAVCVTPRLYEHTGIEAVIF